MGKSTLVNSLAGSKLVLEESRNTASIAEQRHRDRQFGKTIKAHLELKRQRETAR
ncbi:MAG: hypothetical protein IIB76_08590 [Proteobacteria bacterium]|nr:hypothetical protein [Pseudomonadota bacterium]